MGKRFAEHSGYLEPHWPSTLAWTNLMRVSPQRGGNPPDWSYYAQLPHAAALLMREILILKPSVAVFLTGGNWFDPFAKIESRLGLGRGLKCKHVCRSGQLDSTRLIVAQHPQSRPEKEMMTEIAKFWPG